MSESVHGKPNPYRLKPKDFERVNTLEETGQPDPNDVSALLCQNTRREDAVKALRNTSAPRQNTDDPHDVYRTLGQNLMHEQAVERPVELPRRSSGRMKDYIILLLLGNAFFLGSLAVFWGNVFAMAFAFAGACILTAGLTWLIWGVMSDY